MSCNCKIIFHNLLNCLKALSKVFRIRYIRSLVSNLAKYLSKCASAQFRSRLGKRYVENNSSLICFKGRGECLIYILGRCCCRDNYGTRGKYFCAIGITLSHTHRVLAGRDVYSKCTGKITCRLNCVVKTSILALISGRPHPVGTE